MFDVLCVTVPKPVVIPNPETETSASAFATAVPSVEVADKPPIVTGITTIPSAEVPTCPVTALIESAVITGVPSSDSPSSAKGIDTFASASIVTLTEPRLLDKLGMIAITLPFTPMPDIPAVAACPVTATSESALATAVPNAEVLDCPVTLKTACSKYSYCAYSSCSRSYLFCILTY